MGRMSGRGASRASHRGMSRRFRLLAAIVAVATLPVLGTLTSASAAPMDDYPSWQDVINAQRDEANAKALAASLEASLQPLQDAAQAAQDEATRKGEIYAEAQQAYDEQQVVTQALQDQTDAAQAEADQAYTVAAQVISQMSKTGTGDITPQLFTAPGSPEVLLDRLEVSRVLGERYAELYNRALELRNRAKALAEQAKVAEDLLAELQQKTQAAYEEAQAASVAAAAKLAQTEKDIAEIRARIDYLTGVSKETTANYNAGLVAKYGEGAEGEISSTGWARPLGNSHITSMFGMRWNPVSGVYQLHTGVDLAGGGCGATIRAAHDGVVTYAGWYGSWGYYIATDNGDGTGNGYAHIQAGGIGVQVGQHVAPGQPIAKVGSTGESTGCHLHFIVRVHGNRDLTDPVPFMRNQGIVLN